MVSGPEPGVLEQLARLNDGALVLTGTRYHYHSVAEEERTRDESCSDKDEDSSSHAVASLHAQHQLIESMQLLRSTRHENKSPIAVWK